MAVTMQIVARGGTREGWEARRERPAEGRAGRARWSVVSLMLGMLLALGASGCSSPNDTGNLPPDVPDPTTLHTATGAMARYSSVLTLVPGLYDELLTLTGILTDELAALPVPALSSGPYTGLDSRREVSLDRLYQDLHHLRGQAREGRGFLQAYAPDSSPALAGHLLDLEAYAEVALADVFCSGIPLSTVDFGGDYTLQPGSSTAEVYLHAKELFDSALVLTGDSLRLRYLAAVGKGRALLALDSASAAAAAVAAVPDNYRYQITTTLGADNLLASFVNSSVGSGTTTYHNTAGMPSMADREGGNGLDYRSSNDPRTPAEALGPDKLSYTMYFPAKYHQSGTETYTLADGNEARLIEAEAALRAGNAANWLAKLNALRTDGTQDGGGTYNPGTGGVAGLAPLADPGTDAARVDLMFRERAFWLYLTGHRLGDLRRLIRQYGRTPAMVYPVGSYLGGSGSYGNQVVAPVPAKERDLNSRYTGCQHLDP